MPRTLASVDWPIRTARLVLRPFIVDDIEQTWLYRGREDVTTWTGS